MVGLEKGVQVEQYSVGTNYNCLKQYWFDPKIVAKLYEIICIFFAVKNNSAAIPFGPD